MPFAQYTTATRRNEEKPFDVERVNRQIENARTRIADSGFDPGEADKRNALEKFLNLPEDQNFFFDILEILGRPSQGVLNVIRDVPEGNRSPEEAFLRGLTGQSRVRGSELVREAGFENPLAQAILGTGLEVLTDPLNIIPAGGLAKGVSAVARPVGRGFSRFAQAIEPQAVRTFREETVQPLLERTKDALGRAFVPDYKLNETLTGQTDDTISRLKQQTENRIRFMTEESMKNVADAAKLAGGIERGTEVGRIMEAPLKQFRDVEKTVEEVVPAEYTPFVPGSLKVPLERIQDNYLKPLSEYTDKLYRETNAENALELLPGTNIMADTRAPIYFANTPDLALGQGKNKGVLIEFDAGDIQGQLNRSKPGWQVAYNRGQTEFVAKHNNQRTYQQAVRSVTIRPDAEMDRVTKAQLRRVLSGWTKQTNPDGSVTYIRPGLAQKTVQTTKTIKEEIPRPVRELSTDPKIQEAAQQLIWSNNAIRQWAQENGVDYKKMEGYMTHVLAAEERKRRKQLQALPVDRGRFGTGQPNKKILNPRKIPGSVEDINEQIGRTFFEPNAFFATAIGQKRLIEYVNAVNFRRQVLSNPNFATKYEPGMEMRNNWVVIDTNNYKFIDDETAKELGLADEIGGKYIVTKAVKQALDRYQKLTTDEGINGFLKAFDAAQSGWKRLALFSIPYHLRNDIGAKFNNWVAGMNAVDLAKYSAEADKDVYNAVIRNQESDLYREFRQQGLGSSGLSAVEFARRGEEPEEAIRRTIEKRSQFDNTLKGRLRAEAKQLKNPLNAFETSRDFGSFVDQTNRFALYKWAREKKNLSPEEAAKLVRTVQFDYTRLTPLERDVFTRIVPFYRWMRNNIPFQIRQFINDPKKYANINKLRLNATEAAGFQDEDVPDWMKEQFAIPVYGEGNTGKAFGLNLPLADLTSLSDPLKTILDAITPVAKLPAELSLNRSFFYDRPIQEFAGQERQLAIPESLYGIPIPGGGTEFPSALQPNETLAYLLEQLGGQPVRQILNLLASPEGQDQVRKFKDPVLGISSLLKDIDVNKARFFQQQEELQRLMDLIDYIEQQTGQRPRTIQEIGRGG